tara:strand:+ start:361 stop:813 length:453 start_codon:yes stop_codon:yes gene_type:complete
VVSAVLTGLDKNGGGVVQYTLTRTKQRDKNMRHDEERDNTTDIENQIIEADKRAREESAPYPPAYPFPVFGDDPEHDEIGEAETDYDIEYDPVAEFDLSDIPEDGVTSVDLFDSKGRKLFSFSVSTNGVAYQVLQAGEDAGLFTTTEDEV